MAMNSIASIELIPWDSDSDQHVTRLTEQRVQCGWNVEKPRGPWRVEQRVGSKCLYWIVLSKKDPNHDAKLATHQALYPQETTLLKDTATSIRAVSRSPTDLEFHPIGHISLDVDNPDARHLELDLPSTGVYWIKSFYVSRALQGRGVGKAAMDLVEEMATNEPLNATTLALDTAVREDVLRLHAEQPSLGDPSQVSNQDWYLRRGYRQIHIEYGFYQGFKGDDWKGRTIFMRRDLSQE